MSRATLIDVARTAGVGIGTVSRVINDARHVRPTTAQAVRQAMAKLGYEPPAPQFRPGPRLGRRNRAGTAKDVLLLILGSQGLRWILDCAPVYAYVLEGIGTAVTARHRKLIVRQAPDWAALEQILRDTNSEGVILLGDVPNQNPSAFVSDLPTVWIMGAPLHEHGDHVQPDHVQVGIVAAQWALERGHRHCAVIGTVLGSPAFPIAHRNDAFRWKIEQANGRVEMLLDPAIVRRSERENAADDAALARLIDRLAALQPRPTALMLQADLLAPSVYRLLGNRGITPQRVGAVITCNNERPYLASLQPPPTIVDLQAEAIGRRAVDQLFWRAANRREPRMRLQIEPMLVEPDVTTTDAVVV